jgi:hypothetical protein
MVITKTNILISTTIEMESTIITSMIIDGEGEDSLKTCFTFKTVII